MLQKFKFKVICGSTNIMTPVISAVPHISNANIDLFLHQNYHTKKNVYRQRPLRVLTISKLKTLFYVTQSFQAKRCCGSIDCRKRG